jgi:hypothetical protein
MDVPTGPRHRLGDVFRTMISTVRSPILPILQAFVEAFACIRVTTC